MGNRMQGNTLVCNDLFTLAALCTGGYSTQKEWLQFAFYLR
jgi:hypothetical protein